MSASLPCIARRFAVALVALALATAAVAGQEPQQPTLADSCPAEYVIGPEDVLDVAVWGNAEITRTVPVRPDGKISLPLLNDIQAAGLTALELREVLAQKLGEYIPSPEVSVIVS